MFSKLTNIDRRFIFLILAAAIIVPTLLQPRMPIAVSGPTQKAYDHIDALPPGSAILISFDYGPGSMPEPNAIARAIMRHCFSKGIRVIGMTLLAPAATLAHTTMEEVAAEMDAVNGEDYVFLGYRPGIVPVILSIGTSFESVFASDYTGKPLAEIPMMQNIVNYEQIGALVALASGNTVDDWIVYTPTKQNVKIIAGVTAVMATQLFPFLQTGQVTGLLNGYLGAAEYEKLTGEAREGTQGINIATWAHVLIVVLVVIGNIGLFIQRREEKKQHSQINT